MKIVSKYCLGEVLGPRWESSYIELWTYDGSSEDERLLVSKAIKCLMPENKHGVTTLEEWENMSHPTIKIYVDRSNDQVYRTFVTIPHELSHAVGSGILNRAWEFRMKDIYPGCEKIAHITGILTCKFQSAYMKDVGLVVKSGKKE